MKTTSQNNHNKIIHRHHHLLPPPPPTTTHRSSSTIQACAACRYQRRKCAPDCILAPYFPHDRQRQFQNAHKLFGVSNITKIIRNLDRPQKDEAMRTIIYQSDVRAIDPVGGCYRIIRELQRQIEMSCAELEFVLQQLALYQTLGVQNNNAQTHPQYNHDLNVIDEIGFDIHLVNNNIQDDPGKLQDNSFWEDNHVPSQPLNSSDCDDFKSLILINDVTPGDHTNEVKFKEANEPSEKGLYDEETQKALIKVENVCCNEEQYQIEVKNSGFGALTDHKAIHVEGDQYGS